MSGELRTRLEEVGRRPVPAPDPAFADGLEARLLAVAASLPPEPPPTAPPRRPRPRFALGGTLLAGAALVALVVALGAGFGRPVAPELVAPVNTEVALVDGTVLENPDGLRLPEGAVVRVGAGGSARIGDTVLRPGDVATVEQGRLRVEQGQPVGSVTSASPAQSGAPGAGSSRSPSPGASRSPGPRATPSPSPARTPLATPARTATPAPTRPTPTPAPTREPARTPTPTPGPTPTAPPPTATPSPSDAIIRPLLRARFIAPDSIRVAWTAVPGASSYVLVATGSRVAPAPRPQYPGDRVIGEYATPPETPLRFRVPAGIVEVRLLVVALAPDGSVISRSRVVVLATGG